MMAWGSAGEAFGPGEREVYRVRDYKSACEYLLERAMACEEEIWMQIDEGALSTEEREKLFFMLPNYRLARLRVMVLGNMYRLLPVYKSCVRMLAHVRGNEAVSLSVEEKKALEVARAALREVGTEGKSRAEIARALHDWIVLHAAYDVENANFDREYTEGYTPFDGKYLLLERKGVCDSYVQAYWLLLQMAGVPCSMMSGVMCEDGQGHAWNLVHMGDHWAHVDTTFDDPVPDRPGEVQYVHFDKTDEEMEQNRRWARDVFPSAKGEGFLLREVTHVKTPDELQALLRREKSGEWVVEMEHAGAAADPVSEVLRVAREALPDAPVTATQDPFYPRGVRVRVPAPGDDSRAK